MTAAVIASLLLFSVFQAERRNQPVDLLAAVATSIRGLAVAAGRLLLALGGAR